MALTEERFMELMQRMNQEQVINIEKKVAEQLNTVKEDLSGAISKVSDRQDTMEEDQKAMKTQIAEMQVQLKEIKSVSEAQAGSGLSEKYSNPGRSYAAVAGPGVGSSIVYHSLAQGTTSGTTEHDSTEEKVNEIIDVARRTVGLHKIDNGDLKRMRLQHFGGASNEEEEMELAVKEFLKCELKIGSEEIEDMLIENIFIPAKDKGNPQSLNVTFKSGKSVGRIFEKTRIMRKESRVTNYIPRQFQDRLSVLSEFDFNLRADKRYQTRIKMGLKDLELHKKLRGTSKWERVPLPHNLPPVDLDARQPSHVSSSPPPGRPGHDYTRDSKRGRESSGSSDGSQSVAKVAKQFCENHSLGEENTDAVTEDSFDKIIEKADLVSEGTSPSPRKRMDPGVITSVQGTPSRSKPSFDKFEQSPIISKLGRKTLEI